MWPLKRQNRISMENITKQHTMIIDESVTLVTRHQSEAGIELGKIREFLQDVF
jgi:hypothetical protein